MLIPSPSRTRRVILSLAAQLHASQAGVRSVPQRIFVA